MNVFAVSSCSAGSSWRIASAHAISVELNGPRHHARDEQGGVQIERMTHRGLCLHLALRDAERETVGPVGNRREWIELRCPMELGHGLIDTSVDEEHLPVPLMSGCIIRVEREGALIIAFGLAPPPSHTEQIRS